MNRLPVKRYDGTGTIDVRIQPTSLLGVDCWQEDSFISLKKDEGFGDWASFHGDRFPENKDTTKKTDKNVTADILTAPGSLSSKRRSKSKSRRRIPQSNLKEIIINIAPPTPPTSRSKNIQQYRTNDNNISTPSTTTSTSTSITTTTPKISLSRREIRKEDQPYSRRQHSTSSRISKSRSNNMAEEFDDDIISTQDSIVSTLMSDIKDVSNQQKQRPISSRRLLRSIDGRNLIKTSTINASCDSAQDNDQGQRRTHQKNDSGTSVYSTSVVIPPDVRSRRANFQSRKHQPLSLLRHQRNNERAHSLRKFYDNDNEQQQKQKQCLRRHKSYENDERDVITDEDATIDESIFQEKKEQPVLAIPPLTVSRSIVHKRPSSSRLTKKVSSSRSSEEGINRRRSSRRASMNSDSHSRKCDEQQGEMTERDSSTTVQHHKDECIKPSSKNNAQEIHHCHRPSRRASMGARLPGRQEDSVNFFNTKISSRFNGENNHRRQSRRSSETQTFLDKRKMKTYFSKTKDDNIEDHTGKNATVGREEDEDIDLTFVKSDKSEVKSDHARPPSSITLIGTPPKRSYSIGGGSGRGYGRDCVINNRRQQRQRSSSSRRNNKDHHSSGMTSKQKEQHRRKLVNRQDMTADVEAEIEDFLFKSADTSNSRQHRKIRGATQKP